MKTSDGLGNPAHTSSPKPETPTKWYMRITMAHLSWLLVVTSALMAIAFLGTPVHAGMTGLVQMVETAGALERVALWQRGILDLLGMDPSRSFYAIPAGLLAYAARLTYALLFIVQGWAFWLAWRGTTAPFWKWLIGPVGAHLAMLLMPPSNADVFFYEVTGDLALNDINPYVHRMSEFPDNPLLPYNHWVDMTAVYGPVWTSINSLLIQIAGPDPILATLLFKVFLGLCALALSILVYWLVSKLTHRHQFAVAAGVLVAWQPNMIVESTGLAHNDPVMLLISTLGMTLAILGGTRAVRGGVVLIAISSLIKYTSLPLLGILGLARLADRRGKSGLKAVLGSWVLDGVAIAAVMIATFAPYWVGTKTVREMLIEPGRLFSSPLYLYPKVGLEHLGPNSIANRFESLASTGIQLLVVGIVLVSIIRFGKQVWDLPPETPGQPDGAPVAWARPALVAWATILGTLALVPVNAHPWYWTWPVVPIAIVVAYDGHTEAGPEGRPAVIPRWTWVYLALTGIMTIAYHTRIVHP